MNVPLTPLRCLYRAADLFAAKVGVVCGSLRFTYAEFVERCERMAHGLKQCGVKQGDRVAFLSFNTHVLLEGYYGPLLIGAVAMPLNVRLTQVELTTILDHAEACALIFEPEFAPMVEAFRRACPRIHTFISIDEKGQGADFTYHELLSSGQVGRPDFFSVDENAMAELFYTSGSTGTPKGVMLSHRNIYLHALSVAIALQQDETTVALHTIPLFHANGWGQPQTITMLGGTHVMVRRFEPATVFGLIERERATCMMLVPVMANALLNAPNLSEFNFSSLEEIQVGGAAPSPELLGRLEAAFGCRAYAGYGLTETSPVATMARPLNLRPHGTLTERHQMSARAGIPVVGSEVRVVDSAGKAVAKDGQSVGEVVIRGDNVMAGYYREAEDPTAALQDGWLHTGDMAIWDAISLEIVDRKKDIIISGGENISSIEIEKAIFAHPKVLECAVVAAPDEKWGEVPVAIIVVKPDHTLTQDEICSHLDGRLARFKVPRRVAFVAGPLPKTGTGKILKRELREAYWTGKARRVQGA